MGVRCLYLFVDLAFHFSGSCFPVDGSSIKMILRVTRDEKEEEFMRNGRFGGQLRSWHCFWLQGKSGEGKKRAKDENGN